MCTRPGTTQRYTTHTQHSTRLTSKSPRHPNGIIDRSSQRARVYFPTSTEKDCNNYCVHQRTRFVPRVIILFIYTLRSIRCMRFIRRRAPRLWFILLFAVGRGERSLKCTTPAGTTKTRTHHIHIHTQTHTRVYKQLSSDKHTHTSSAHCVGFVSRRRPFNETLCAQRVCVCVLIEIP